MNTDRRHEPAASQDPFGIRAHSQSAQNSAASEHSQPLHEHQVNPLWMITVALFACLLLIARAMNS